MTKLRSTSWARFGLPVLLGVTGPGPGAQAQPASPTGTLIVAHGGDPAWNDRVRKLAADVRTGGPVEVAFLMGAEARTHRFQDRVARLENAGAGRIVVVPLLVSSHSGHFEQVRYLAGQTDSLEPVMRHHLEMAGIERPRAEVPLRIVRGLDDSEHLAAVLSDRARSAVPEPAGRALMLVAHGPNSPEEHAAWMENLRRVARMVQARTGFTDVRVELLRDDAPPEVRAEAVLRIREMVELQARATGGKEVVVVPVLISAGAISRSKLPSDLAGLPVRYSGEPLLPHAALVRWVEEQVALPGRQSGR